MGGAGVDTNSAASSKGQILSMHKFYKLYGRILAESFAEGRRPFLFNSRGSQLLPRVYEILVILASKYMGLMGDSRASVRDSALILASVADPSV